VSLLLLKLTITPAVIAFATLAARRFGPAVGGWLIGLPFTCGPVALFVALEHGPGFASKVATGFVAGITAQAAFVLGYVAVAARGGRWQVSLAAGLFALMGFACTLVLVLSRMPLADAFAVALVFTLSIQLGSLPVLRGTGVAGHD
jgi:hypothetical protein